MPTSAQPHLVSEKDIGGVPALHHRVSRLEIGHDHLMMKHHELDKEITRVREDLKYIRNSVDAQSAGIKRILWAIGISFATAASSFVIHGGLTMTP